MQISNQINQIKNNTNNNILLESKYEIKELNNSISFYLYL